MIVHISKSEIDQNFCGRTQADSELIEYSNEDDSIWQEFQVFSDNGSGFWPVNEPKMIWFEPLDSSAQIDTAESI